MAARALALLVAAFAGTANAAPQRAASLGLCTDEMLLLIAAPEQIATVSFLGADVEETPLARPYPRNDGSLESALRHQPDLIVTGGLVNARAGRLATSIGMETLDLPPPRSIADLEMNIERLGNALGREARAMALIAWMRAKLGRKPAMQRRALSVQTGGFAGGGDGIAAELLTYAGITLDKAPEPRLNRERLLIDPPRIYIRSAYRAGQFSLAQSWRPPESAARNLWLDGRAWTCAGPLTAIDVARLRQELTP